MEYEVTHPKWQVRPVELAQFNLDVETLYGGEWTKVLSGEPDSVVLADGSAVAVLAAPVD